jgi:hypothetical protein
MYNSIYIGNEKGGVLWCWLKRNSFIKEHILTISS